MDLEYLKKQIIKNYSGFKEIKSAYIYGSSLSNRFDSKRSDIDILFICDDSKNPKKLFSKIIKAKKRINAKLDINIVFYQEFLNRWHIYRPPTYFIGIRIANELLWGDDLISIVKNTDFSPKDLYKRITDLAQGIRGVYINEKNDNFWIEKYRSWLKVFLLEVLFMQGNFDLNFKTGLSSFLKMNPELKIVRSLLKNKIDIKQLNCISEILRVYIYNNYIKK